MTYSEVVNRLGLTGVCLGGCGIRERSHKRGFIDPFGGVHWQERRVSKRGLRNFLLLVAKRDRTRPVEGWTTRGFLNDPGLYWAAMYLDEQRANEWAGKLGVRFPIALSLPERRTVSLVPGLSRLHPAVWAWARRGAA